MRSACGLDPVSTNAMVMTSAGAELGEDWSKFQNALKIVQTCGKLYQYWGQWVKGHRSKRPMDMENHDIHYDPSIITAMTSTVPFVEWIRKY